MQTQILVSKLLATEDISVVRSNVATASFDIEARILTLPNWKNMSECMEMMLIGHEVSHALHTTKFYIEKIKEFNKPNFPDYMNIVEDARIERMIKRKYPGLRKDFYEASRELVERDLMGTSKKSIDEFKFIDRINIFFKVGNHILVDFSDKERALVDKVDNTVTEQDVYDVAVEIYNFASKEKKKQDDKKEQSEKSDSKEQEKQEQTQDSDEDENQSESEDGDDSESGTKSSNEDGDDQNQKQETASGDQEATSENSEKEEKQDVTPSASETSESLSRSLSNMVSMSKTMEVCLDPLYDVNVIPEKTFQLAASRLMNTVNWTDTHVARKKNHLIKLEKYSKFRGYAAKTINHLVNEFEMRKAADQHKRTTVAKSGQLNISRVAEYKIVDDMFKRFNIVPDAQNHGMIVMLDWSGSMAKKWYNTIEQLYILVQFMKRVGIKFEVHAFSDNPGLGADPACDLVAASVSVQEYAVKFRSMITNKPLDIRKSDLSQGKCVVAYFGDRAGHILTSIIKLVSDKTSTSNIENVMKFLYTFPTGVYSDQNCMSKTPYSFGTTPTNQALIFEIGYVNKFQKANNIQKMNTVLLTDGEPTSAEINQPNSYGSSNYFSDNLFNNVEYICTLKGSRTPVSFIVSNNTNRNVPSRIQSVLFTFFKQMTNSSLTMYYIGSNKEKHILQNLQHIFFEPPAYLSDRMRPIIREVKKTGWAEVQHNTLDKMIFIGYDDSEINDNFYSHLDGNKSASSLAKMITKANMDSFNSKAFAHTLINTFN